MIEIVVGSRLRLRREDLPDGVEDELRAGFTHDNPQYAALISMGLKAWKEPRKLMTWTVDGPDLVLSRGGMWRLRNVLVRNRLDWTVRDERTEGNEKLAGHIPGLRVALRDYQEEMVQAAIERENCLLRAPTGSGKTVAALGLISRIGLPSLVVVWNGALLRQWCDRAKCDLGVSGDMLGLVQGSTRRIRPLTLAMQQTLWRIRGPEWEWIDRQFGVVVADEVQRCPARTVMDVFNRLSARYRIGISASERRKDRKEFLTYDVFGKVAAEIEQDELIERGVVHDVEVRVVPTDFLDEAYAARRESYAEAKAEGGEAETPDFRELLDHLEVDEQRNERGMRLALAEVAEGRSVIMLSHRRDHCRRFCQMAASAGVRSGLLLGGVEDASEFERCVRELRSGELKFAAGTIQAIGQGIDLPAVSRGIVMTPVAGNKFLWGQVRGRMCRRAEGKVDAAVYYLLDVPTVGLGHLANLCAWNARVVVLDGTMADGRDWLREERKRQKEASGG